MRPTPSTNRRCSRRARQDEPPILCDHEPSRAAAPPDARAAAARSRRPATIQPRADSARAARCCRLTALRPRQPRRTGAAYRDFESADQAAFCRGAASLPPSHRPPTRAVRSIQLAARAANPDYGEDYGDSDDEDSEYDGAAAGTSYGGYLYGDDEYDDITDSTCAAPANPSPRVVTDIPQQPQHSVSFAPGSSIPPPLPQPYSQQQQLLQEGAGALVPPGREVGAANSPRSPRTPRLSPRSLALHTPRAKEAKRRWKLVKKRLLCASFRRSARGWTVTVVGGGGGGKRFSSQMWSVATEDWEERSVENALRSFKPLQPLTEMELRVLLQYSSLTTIARYARSIKGLPRDAVLPRASRVVAAHGRPNGAGKRLTSPFFGRLLRRAVRGCLARRSTRRRATAMHAVHTRRDTREQAPAGNERLKRAANGAPCPWAVRGRSRAQFVPFFFQPHTHKRSLRCPSPLLSAKLFEPGDEIIKEGDPGDCVYVLVQGEVRVYKKRGDSLLSVIESRDLGPVGVHLPRRVGAIRGGQERRPSTGEGARCCSASTRPILRCLPSWCPTLESARDPSSRRARQRWPSRPGTRRGRHAVFVRGWQRQARAGASGGCGR